MRLHLRILLGASLAAGLAGIAPARADTVYLKNGKSLDGLILSATSTKVVLDLGVGTMTLSQDKVDRIVRGDARQTAEIRKQWQDRYFLHPKFAPKGWEDFAAALRAVLDQRDRAVAAHQALDESDRNEARKREEVQRRQAAWLDASRKLQATPPQQDVAAYNRLVAESNAIQANVSLLYQELERIAQARTDSRRTIAAYLSSLAALRASFEQRRAESGKSAEDSASVSFREKVADQIEALEREVAAVTVKATVEGGSAFVSAVVNERWAGRFLVDTGANLVTLSEEFARRAGIDSAAAPSGTVIVADGNKVTAKGVILDSVQVGDARVRSVPATILPQSVHPSVDGLLGMSFLRHFDIRLNGTTGQLTLSRFTPP